MNIAYNMDCLEAMREMPDNAFDLAVVDPPYGSGLPDEMGGVNIGSDLAEGSTSTAQKMVNRGGVARQAEIPPRHTTKERMSDSRTEPGVTRVGGTWATKYAKKLLRGTQRREQSILSNCSVSHETRLSGAATTSRFHRRVVS